MTGSTTAHEYPPRGRMPVLFVGRGSPMNAIEHNRWSEGFAALREFAPEPSAILAVSAHWYDTGTYLTGNDRPATIHDFSGFPQALFEVEYPAPGDVDLARRVRTLLAMAGAELSSDWGIDHGTWSVLRWIFPEANIPVIQLSIDCRLDVHRHYELGRALAALREEGVLVVGSGNVVHNLRDAFRRRAAGSPETPPWASRFDEAVAQALMQRDTKRLLTLWPNTDDGRMAHPTPEHWLPLIYACGASDDRDAVRFPVEGFDWGSLSMRNVVFGQS